MVLSCPLCVLTNNWILNFASKNKFLEVFVWDYLQVQWQRCRIQFGMEESSLAVKELSLALSKYEAVEKKYYALLAYYGSGRWMKDFEDDKKGKLPASLKRGVLSEDGVYDLICEHRDLVKQMSKCVTAYFEKG